MKRINRILCGIFALMFLSFSVVIWWQWDNLRALKQAMQFSSEELEQQMQENQQLIQDAVNAAPEITIRDVTEEERQALKDGTLTQEELVDRLVNTESSTAAPSQPKPERPSQPTTPIKPDAQNPVSPPTSTPQPEPPESPAVPDPDYQQNLSALIAEVYVLREQYTIELDNMYETAKREYKAMPKSKRTKDKLSKWAMGYVSQANQLEKTCDASMDDIVVRMETLIRANRGDLSLVDTVVYTYANEKSLKKSFYMSMLEEKGLIR